MHSAHAPEPLRSRTAGEEVRPPCPLALELQWEREWKVKSPSNHPLKLLGDGWRRGNTNRLQCPDPRRVGVKASEASHLSSKPLCHPALGQPSHFHKAVAAIEGQGQPSFAADCHEIGRNVRSMTIRGLHHCASPRPNLSPLARANQRRAATDNWRDVGRLAPENIGRTGNLRRGTGTLSDTVGPCVRATEVQLAAVVLEQPQL
jgi:hypothetical protein